MGTKEQDARERILRATIICIERDGLDATGIREIAREAQVNSAAISYYFRSKEKLITQALDSTLDQAFTHVLLDFDRLLDEGLSVREAFETLLEDVVGNVGRYPRIAHAHLHDALVHQRYDGAAVQRLNTFLEALSRKLAPATPHLKEARRRLALTQVWSSILLVSMLPRVFDQVLLLDFRTLDTRRAWVKQYTRLLFPS
ncbi:TetR family transcriptional regulator [Myxococcus sp. MISCRS1]|uniref:TetR/AcrR family transcriptional regulator n=1 Tax=Myxococcus sp. MISCRS1 TaxID=2996786 RepID=UPI00226EC767|nr:TetR family transcriptional regulator [Myxococcus sp. MISCRS1]MCY1001129.1 TetR family transcriptional regulator [Myxococcus sp. MISCRS1]BDT37305.1 TetR family transcriptional regulator [Myxococcus sp. MH1]